MNGREPDIIEAFESLGQSLGAARKTDRIVPLPIEVQPWQSHSRWIGGCQHIYRFANGYGASVVQGSGTYGNAAGLWELAVAKFAGENWEITYDTPITSDVIGWLDAAGVAELLVRIAALEQIGELGQ